MAPVARVGQSVDFLVLDAELDLASADFVPLDVESDFLGSLDFVSDDFSESPVDPESSDDEVFFEPERLSVL